MGLGKQYCVIMRNYKLSSYMNLGVGRVPVSLISAASLPGNWSKKNLCCNFNEAVLYMA